jgi:integrase
MRDAQSESDERNVLEFDHGVRAYPPANPGGYWRIRWDERRKRKDTTASSRSAAIAKASEIVERLGRSAPTELGRSSGADLVTHYLDPNRRPPRVKEWSIRHRDEQTRYCNLYVLPVVGDLPCRELTRDDFQLILDRAPTASVAQHIRRCLTGIVAAGLEEGHLLARQDLLRGVRWHGAELQRELDRDSVDRAVTEAEIPSIEAVHALARRAAERSGVWWRELQILLVAYSGLRWGEHVALLERQLDVERRRIKVDRQSIETRSALVEGLPKGRRRRVTMFPEVTPAGVDLSQMVRRRLDEVEPGGLVFPAPQGGFQRRSNYGRYLWDRAATDIDWPRQSDGRWLWTFHSLRHVFATWALHNARIPIEDLSRLMGHSSTRVTQDIYIHVRDDMFDRFFEATGHGDGRGDSTGRS